MTGDITTQIDATQNIRSKSKMGYGTLFRSKRQAAAVAFVLLVNLFLYGGQGSAANASSLQATQPCGALTPAVTEGPYYKVGSPERSSLLEVGTTGTPVTIIGYVYDKSCRPIAHAWLDFWQASSTGVYDNSGYKLRGHLYTDASGAYKLTTVVPGEYPGRTEHIHVKVQAANGPVLTTQLFFPGVVHNSSDSIYNPALLMNVQTGTSGETATFNFVLDIAVAPSTVQPTTPTALATAQTTTQPTVVAATPTIAAGSGHTFKETGFTVSGDFWTAWQGGRQYADSLYINGLPITGVQEEVSPTDGKMYKVQWFERARFEYHPENAAPNNVLLGLLGTAAARSQQGQTSFKAVGNPGGATTWYSQTGHTLGDNSAGGQAISAAWTRLGGLKQFGYPISQPFTQVSKDDGKSYLVQYFERQRLEYHAENKGTQYEVLLGRLGAEQIAKAP
ncbi:MAG: hypothetical protein M3014_08675 [Chloroflexota bacterium]|nr:hypothetical protein [Chloroflexota bacterium]